MYGPIDLCLLLLYIKKKTVGWADETKSFYQICRDNMSWAVLVVFIPWVMWWFEFMIQHIWVNSWLRHQIEYFPRYWLFVRGFHRSPVNSPHKGQWFAALMFSLICAWTNGWVSNRGTCDLKRQGAHYVATVKLKKHGIFMCLQCSTPLLPHSISLCSVPDISIHQ